MTESHRIESDQKPDTAPVPDNAEVEVSLGEDGKVQSSRAKVQTENPETGARPDWLPEKFDSPEALAKSYRELEKKLSQERNTNEAGESTSEENDDDSSESSGEELTDATIKKVEKAVEDAPQFDFEGLAKEYVENEGLSDETYESLEAKGLPRNVIDAYLEGQKAIAARATSELAEAVGGAERFKAVQTWAGENLSEQELASYNAAVNSGDFATAKLLLRGIADSYRSATGSEPSLVKGETVPANRGPQPFKSNAEMTAAINDPRYLNDPAYRREVERRIMAGG